MININVTNDQHGYLPIPNYPLAPVENPANEISRWTSSLPKLPHCSGSRNMTLMCSEAEKTVWLIWRCFFAVSQNGQNPDYWDFLVNIIFLYHEKPHFWGMVFASTIKFSSLEFFPTFRHFRTRTSAVSFEMAKALASAAAWLNLAWDGDGLFELYFRHMIATWYPKHPTFKNGWKSGWMTPNHYMENWCFTKHPLKKCLFRVPGSNYMYLGKVWSFVQYLRYDTQTLSP